MNKTLYLLAALTVGLSACGKQSESNNGGQTNQPLESAENSSVSQPIFSSMTDERDGTSYKTVKIGEQLWFAENLNTTQYKDGTPIPLGDDVDVFSFSEEERNFYFNPNGDAKNAETYGRLYSYAAAIQGVCPTGWRVASDADWIIMEMALGMSVEDVLGHHFDRGRGEELAPKMMATEELWPGSVGTNETGFNVLPAGYKTLAQGTHPSFAFFGERAYFVTTTRGPEGVVYDGTKPLNRAIRRNFEPGNIAINRDSNIPMGYGFSVRCVEGDYFPAEKQHPAKDAANPAH